MGSLVLARGKLRVTPGEVATTRALRNLQKEGVLQVAEVQRNWPKIIVYDVDR